MVKDVKLFCASCERRIKDKDLGDSVVKEGKLYHSGCRPDAQLKRNNSPEPIVVLEYRLKAIANNCDHIVNDFIDNVEFQSAFSEVWTPLTKVVEALNETLAKLEVVLSQYDEVKEVKSVEDDIAEMEEEMKKLEELKKMRGTTDDEEPNQSSDTGVDEEY